MKDSIIRNTYALAEPWMFGVLLLVLAVLAFVQHTYPGRIINLFRTAFNERLTRQVIREEQAFSHRASWLLLFVSASVFALIAVLMLRAYGQTGDFVQFGLVWLFVSAWVLLRGLMRMLLAWLSKQDYGFKEFSYVSASLYKLLGIVLLPIAICIAYLPQNIAMILLYVALAVLLIAFVYRLLRGFLVGRHYVGLSFYMIIYLCALELIPTLVIIRAMVSQVQIL